MDSLKMFKGRREARRKCAYLQSILDEKAIYLNIEKAKEIYFLWKMYETNNNYKYKKNRRVKSYNFYNCLVLHYKYFAKEFLENKDDIEKEIAYICYALGM